MSKKSILIVDDDSEALNTMQGILEAQNYHVLRAADGLEAVQKAKAQCPDLIIMDIMMPKVDGLEACCMIKKNPAQKKVPILVLTAKEQVGDADNAFKAGADEYVQKPIDWTLLLPKIKTILG